MLEKTLINFGVVGTGDMAEGLPVINEVDGKTDDCDIANTIFFIPSLDASQAGRVIDDVSAVQSVSYDVREWLISVEDVDCAVRNQLKLRKAAGYDNITAEHIIFAHPKLIILLCDLFNLMLVHGYVPVSFGKGVLVPLLKDHNALLNRVTNYRGITLSPVV